MMKMATLVSPNLPKECPLDKGVSSADLTTCLPCVVH